MQTGARFMKTVAHAPAREGVFLEGFSVGQAARLRGFARGQSLASTFSIVLTSASSSIASRSSLERGGIFSSWAALSRSFTGGGEAYAAGGVSRSRGRARA